MINIIGIPVGFYGYIFPGNINLMVLELYVSKRYRLLVPVLGLIVLFESIYCALSLTFLNSIKNNSNFYTSIEIVSYSLIFVMGLWMVAEKQKNKRATRANTILRGVLSIIIHPQQIPFWLIAGILINRFVHFNMSSWAFVAF